MQMKHGELLPREEALVRARAVESHVAEKSMVILYHSHATAQSFYAVISFAVGCVLGVLLFILTRDAYSSNVDFALLQSMPLGSVGDINVSIVPPQSIFQSSIENLSSTKPSSIVMPLPVRHQAKGLTAQQERAIVIEVTRIESGSLHRIVSRAISLASTQGYISAEKTLLREYRQGNSNQALLSALGALYSKHRKWRKAVLSYARACHNYVLNAQCFYNLAVSYDHLKNHDKAIINYRKALRQDVDAASFSRSDVERRIMELRQW